MANAVARLQTGTPSARPFSGVSKVIALTGTVQYGLWKNVLSRLEVRWDHSANGSDAFGGEFDPAGATPDKRNAFLVAANIIYKF